MLKARFRKYILIFKQPATTSRGVLKAKSSWFIFLFDDQNPKVYGIGECAPLPGLSFDDQQNLEPVLEQTCNNIGQYIVNSDRLADFPSVRFGIEMAMIDLNNGGKRILFASDFTEGADSIPIHGLIWMDDRNSMQKQIWNKIATGFDCIKLKIGALHFDDEIDLIRNIRKRYTESEIIIRLDANGSFRTNDALEKIKRLSEYNIHSIEQPIRQGQQEEIAALCRTSPIPVALDEELIGIRELEQKKELIRTINPKFLVLKPSLLGGFKQCREWIDLAEEYQTGWWITSALESNVGLNAIAQWTYSLGNREVQGLGTGQLYSNNFISPLLMDGNMLLFKPEQGWVFPDEWR
jgi:o-succinylbenzoate synthase